MACATVPVMCRACAIERRVLRARGWAPRTLTGARGPTPIAALIYAFEWARKSELKNIFSQIRPNCHPTIPRTTPDQPEMLLGVFLDRTTVAFPGRQHVEKCDFG